MPTRRLVPAVIIAVAVLLLAACQPEGSVDSATATQDGVRLSGWARDPDTMDSIAVHVYANGSPVAFDIADDPRPDVEAGMINAGPEHGFDVTVALPGGQHTLCVYGIDAVGGDANSLIGCKTVVVPSGDPVGRFESVADATGGVRLQGWTFDPNSSDSLAVHVYVDGSFVAATTASGDRPDVAGVVPGAILKSGFDLVIPKAGTQVCAYAINVGAGANSSLGCLYMPGMEPPPGPSVSFAVTSGAFCSEHGWYGRTVTGLLMRCTTTLIDSRYRWREV
jgi:hypothetical protein